MSLFDVLVVAILLNVVYVGLCRLSETLDNKIRSKRFAKYLNSLIEANPDHLTWDSFKSLIRFNGMSDLIVPVPAELVKIMDANARKERE